MQELMDVIEAWRRHNKITLYVLGNLPAGGLDAVVASDNMPVRQHFAHVSDVRVNWAFGTAPKLTANLIRFNKQPERVADYDTLKQALEESGELIEMLLTQLAQKGQGIKGFPGSLTTFVTYLISHESYHWSEISMTLAQNGNPLHKEVLWGMWRGWWDKDFKYPIKTKAKAAKPARLKRERYPMPDDIHAALNARKLMPKYKRRPDYQQNDYIGWITRAKQPATRQKRLAQMLDELTRGDTYMKMAYKEK